MMGHEEHDREQPIKHRERVDDGRDDHGEADAQDASADRRSASDCKHL
jgi:hypothetical protein